MVKFDDVKIEWWVGSNGNLFGDYGDFRYCISKQGAEYRIARNGHEICLRKSIAEAKQAVIDMQRS